MAMTVTTNNQPRELLCFWDIPESAREDFDYVGEEERVSSRFFKYRGAWYDANEFQYVPASLPPNLAFMRGWHGQQGESYFSAVLIRYSQDYEAVTVGLALS
jgi:hypothetical protein